MFGKNRTTGKWWYRDLAIAAVALLAGLLVSQAYAVEPPVSRKMARQIDVMERIIDQVLLDSPNFLVGGRHDTRGLYLGDFGVVYTFAASLVERDGDDWSFHDFGGFKVFYNDDGKPRVVFGGDDDDEYSVRGRDRDRDDDDDDDGDRRKRRSRSDRIQERLYKRGKAELVDVMLDYGDTMTTLKDGQRVAIVAFLSDASFFKEARISRLVLTAKIDDLRAYTAERISEEEMVKRIEEQEY